jgi:hypothetical protein
MTKRAARLSSETSENAKATEQQFVKLKPFSIHADVSRCETRTNPCHH